MRRGRIWFYPAKAGFSPGVAGLYRKTRGSLLAAETSIVSGIAGRYAAALFDLARERDALDSVADELNQLAGLLQESADLRRLVSSPILQREAQAAAMEAVLSKAGASDIVSNFVGVLAKNRRLNLLADIIRDFSRLLSRHRGEVEAEVVSAKALTKGQMTSLVSALKDVAGRGGWLRTRVDDSLIGGLVVKVGSRMIDTSIRTKLQNLQLVMKGVG